MGSKIARPGGPDETVARTLIGIDFKGAWKDPSRYQRFMAACLQIDAVLEYAVKQTGRLTQRGDRSQRAGALYYLATEFRIGVTAREIAILFGLTPRTIVEVYQIINRALLHLSPKPWEISYSIDSSTQGGHRGVHS